MSSSLSASPRDTVYQDACRACKGTGKVSADFSPFEAACRQCDGAGTALYQNGAYWPRTPRADDEDRGPDDRYEQVGPWGDGWGAGRAQ